jgi:hypothetical protein
MSRENCMKNRVIVLGAAACAAAGLLAGCGILTAPVSLPAAVAQNANLTFQGAVVDQNGRLLDGVVIRRTNSHHLWMPLSGSRDIEDTKLRRADGRFGFEDRGQSLDFTFSKNGYKDAVFNWSAAEAGQFRTPLGIWRNVKDFPVVLLSTERPDAELAHVSQAISYGDYPVADCISLPNLATKGRNGDVVWSGKDARDTTVFPAGTLYATVGKEPPQAINAKGDLDPADLDVPDHITLTLPGVGCGLMRIEPRVGFHPMATSDVAPAAGYVHELRFNRSRLRAMKLARRDDILLASEYFFFKVGDRFGKGRLSWAGGGKGGPVFRYELYLQPQEENRDLQTHGYGG